MSVAWPHGEARSHTREQGHRDGGRAGQREGTDERGRRDGHPADHHRVRDRREVSAREHREGRRDDRGHQAVHPLVGPRVAAELEDHGEQHPDAQGAQQRGGAVLPARREQDDIGDQTPGEGEGDALAGGPHAVEPEPSGGRHRLEEHHRDEQGVGPDRRAPASSRPSTAVSAAGCIPGAMIGERPSARARCASVIRALPSVVGAL